MLYYNEDDSDRGNHYLLTAWRCEISLRVRRKHFTSERSVLRLHCITKTTHKAVINIGNVCSNIRNLKSNYLKCNDNVYHRLQLFLIKMWMAEEQESL